MQLTEDLLREIFSGVLPAIALILLIAGALLLVVLALQFAAKVNALPRAGSTPLKSSWTGPEPQQDNPSLDNGLSSTSTVHIQITAQNYQSVSVQWTIPVDLTHTLRQDRGNALMIRLLDVTQIDLSTQLPHAVYDYPCDWGPDDTPQVMGIAVVQGDRDYIAELGYMTADRQWRQLARSGHVRVAATVPSR
ncbi:MAG: DUF4912 domain-containing protein [Cyanobacteria bacterium P01_F01_bin.150]